MAKEKEPDLNRKGRPGFNQGTKNARLERDKTAHRRMYTQTTTPEVNPNQQTQQPKRTVRDRLTGRNKPANTSGQGTGTFNDPDRPGGNQRTTGGGKTSTGAPGSGSQKPNFSARNPGKPAFGGPPPERTPRKPGVGKVKGTLGTIGAFGLARETARAVPQAFESQSAYDTYGALTPEDQRVNFNPIGAAVDDVASIVTAGNADPNILERGMSAVKRMFGSDEPFKMNDSTWQRDAMAQAAAADEMRGDAPKATFLEKMNPFRTNPLSEVPPEMVADYQARAANMQQQIADGTFDPAALSPEDQRLATYMGVQLDRVYPTSRTGIPDNTPAVGVTDPPAVTLDNVPELGGGGPERSDPADVPSDYIPEDVFSGIDVANPDDARIVLEKINSGQPVGPIEVGIAEQLKAEGLINDYNQGGTTTIGTPATAPPAPPVGGGGGGYSAPEGASEGAPTLFRKVGEDGVVEYSDQGGAGFEEVQGDMQKNFKGGYVPTQDNMQDFPGTSAFVQGISNDARARKRDFQRQQRRARTMQRRLPQRARSAVNSANRDLVRTAKKGGLAGGVASHALNNYTLEMAKIMQQGRDAFSAEDFDTTTPVLEADRNDTAAAGVDADLARTQTYRDANEIAAFRALQDGQQNALELQQKFGKESRDVINQYAKNNFRLTDENGDVNPQVGRFNSFMTALTDGTETPRQVQEMAGQAHFLTELSPFMQGIPLDPQAMLGEDFIERLLNNEFSGAGITAQKNPTVWQRIKSPMDTTKASFSKSQLDSALIDFNGKTITLENLLDMAQGYGKVNPRATSLSRNNYSER